MNALQEKKLKMYMAVRDYLLQNATVTTNLPSFQVFFTAVQNGINQIQVLQEQKETRTTGITATKNQMKLTLIGQAVDVSRKIVAYASIGNNLVLNREVKFSESELRKAPDTILRDRTQLIHDRAVANLNELGQYGISDALLSNLQNAIDVFNAFIPKVRLGVTEKKQTNFQLDTSFDVMDENLRKIDLLMEILRMDNPNFFKGYRSARKIVDTSVKYAALKAGAMDKITGLPVAGAHFLFEPADGSSTFIEGKIMLEKKTATKGSFLIKNLPEGSYAVKVIKPGYREQLLNVNISSNERTTLEVVLERA